MLAFQFPDASDCEKGQCEKRQRAGFRDAVRVARTGGNHHAIAVILRSRTRDNAEGIEAVGYVRSGTENDQNIERDGG